MSGYEYIFSTMLIFSIMLSIIFFLAWKTIDHVPHALSWSILYFLVSITYLISAAKNLFPSHEFYWISVNLVSLAVQGLALIGFRQRANLLPCPASLIVYLVAVELLIFWFTYINHHIGLAMAITPVSGVILLVTCALVVYRGSKPLRPAEVGVIVIFIIYAVVQFAAGFTALSQGAEKNEEIIAIYNQIILIAAPPAYAGLALFTVFILADDLSFKMKKLASTDALTGIMNRRGFEEAALRAVAYAVRKDQNLTLVLADIDHFKRINDEHGHQVGDRVLQEFANIFRKSIRQEDLLGRVGGEEFAALLIQSNLEQSIETIERLRNLIENTDSSFDGIKLTFTSSFGLYQMDPASDSIGDAIHNADIGLYRAKDAGRNNIKLFENSQTESGT